MEGIFLFSTELFSLSISTLQGPHQVAQKTAIAFPSLGGKEILSPIPLFKITSYSFDFKTVPWVLKLFRNNGPCFQRTIPRRMRVMILLFFDRNFFKLNFLNKFGFKVHGTDTINLAGNVMAIVTLDETDVFYLGTYFNRRG